MPYNNNNKKAAKNERKLNTTKNITVKNSLCLLANNNNTSREWKIVIKTKNAIGFLLHWQTTAATKKLTVINMHKK